MILLVHHPVEGSRFEICQQSFGEGIGWYNQQSVQLEPGQVAGLRNAIGAVGRKTGISLPDASHHAPASDFPRIARADSA